MLVKRVGCAGGVVLHPTEKDKIVIVNQKSTSWAFPKGHMELNESPLETARREIYEETGLNNLSLEKELGTYERTALLANGNENPLEIKTIHMFLFHALTETLSPLDPDNPCAIWVNIKESVQLLTHPKDREFLSHNVIPFIYTLQRDV